MNTMEYEDCIAIFKGICSLKNLQQLDLSLYDDKLS